jgi:hypothetical protein
VIEQKIRAWGKKVISVGHLGPFLTLPLAPEVNLATGGEICPLGGMFTRLFTTRGECSLLFRKVERRTKNFTPRG